MYSGRSVFFLNISSILYVSIKPPAILNEEMSTARAANECATVWGSMPPPSKHKPPAAVIPEIAFVIDIKGVWSAACTPQID